MSATLIARQLYEKISGKEKAVAVFLTPAGTNVRTCGTGTDLYRDACIKSPERLVGIYDNCVKEAWLYDDLRYMGMPA